MKKIILLILIIFCFCGCRGQIDLYIKNSISPNVLIKNLECPELKITQWIYYGYTNKLLDRQSGTYYNVRVNFEVYDGVKTPNSRVNYIGMDYFIIPKLDIENGLFVQHGDKFIEITNTGIK